MFLLNKDNYNKVFGPLRNLSINNLFARSVIEKHVSGTVYVDNINQPKSFYVIHPYGMSLLFGKSDNEEFNEVFRDHALNINQTRSKHEWMQAYPNNWDHVLIDLFNNSLIKSSDNSANIESEIVELNTRVNFEFKLDKYTKFKQNYIEKNLLIVRTNRNAFTEMIGSVVPINFWDSAEDFCEKGIGFSLFHEKELASTAFSSYIHGSDLELGIETIENYRGKGFAIHVCSALIDYCIENNYKPIWSCRLENIVSYKLALKLGFEPTLRLPYYRLSN